MRFLRQIITTTAVLIAATSAQGAVIFSDGFESGTALGPAWATSGSGAWRVRTSTSYKYAGTRGLTFDSSTSGGYATSQATLTANTAGYSALSLTFRMRNIGDESHTTDGLYLSGDNGATWKKVTWSFPAIGSTWSLHTINIAQQAGNLGVNTNGSLKIRWQQYDDYPISSDGVAIDDVVLSGNPPGPSVQGGMGPLPYSGGTGFRVWAPNASSVSVAGDFNGWSDSLNHLFSEGNGNWSLDLPGALINDQYKYVIRNGAETLWKNDPRSQHVTNSVGNSVIHDTTFNWNHTGPTQTLFTENFEGATLSPEWVVSGTTNKRVALSTTYKAAGTKGVTLDCAPTGTYTTTQLTRIVNATNMVNLVLAYKIRNVGDETHTQDGLHISNDGTTWYKVSGYPAISSSWSTINVNLSTAASGFGITPGGNFRIRFQQYDDFSLSSDGIALDDISLAGNLSSSGNFTTPSWNEMVIYQMHIGTFNDSPGFGPGNFNSAIAKLDFVRDMGYNVVQVLPINEFAADFSWGYNPAYPYAVESVYGGHKEYKRFIKEAHARGLAVVQDVVYNHFGPSDLDMWRFDGWSQNGFGGIFFYNDWKANTPWGATRPDYGRGEVRSFLRDNAMLYLQDYRVDGLRWDSTVNIRNSNNGQGGDIPEGWSLMQWINNEIDATQGWKISIAEDLQNNDYLTKTTGAGGTGFDSQWDAAFVHPIRSAIITGSDNDRNMFAVRDAIAKKDNGDAFKRVVYTESHDEVANGKARVAEEIWPGNAGSWFSRKRSTLGGAMVLTAPGIPMLFMGQDILEDGWWADEDPIDWNKLTLYPGINNMYRDLIRLRRNWFNNTRGLRGQGINVHHVNNTNKLVAYHRWQNGGAGDDVIIIVNMGNQGYSSYNLGFPQSGTWYVRFNSDWNGYSSDFSNWNSYDTNAVGGAKDGMGYNANVGIGPYSVIILSQ